MSSRSASPRVDWTPPSTAPVLGSRPVATVKPQRPQHYHSHTVISEAATRLKKATASGVLPEEIRRFEVILDDPDQVFFSGHCIRGHIRIELDSCFTVQGIIVRFVGEAAVNVAEEPSQWVARQLRSNIRRNKISPGLVDSSVAPSEHMTDSPERCRQCRAEEDWAKSGVRAPPARRPRPRPRQTKFRSYEKYFEHKVFVFGHKYSSRREQLWAGSHRFPFQYTLPSKLPASFHGRFGYVRYFCEASLERAGKSSLLRRTLFSVSNIADINAEPKAESGAYGQRSTNSCLFCCKRGTVIASAKLKRTGFVPGEDIVMSADVINMSDRPVFSSNVKITQVVTYFSSKGFRNHVDEAVVSQLARGPVPSGDSDTWVDVPIHVPPLPPSTKFTNCCKVLDVSYRLDFHVDLDSEPLEIRLPLWIGTVPLHREFANLVVKNSIESHQGPVDFPATTVMKYGELPIAYPDTCVWGPRPVDFYFSKSSARHLRPTERTFVVRYPTYRPRPAAESTLKMLLRKAATDIPKIIITRPPGCCPRHNHTPEPPDTGDGQRRHSLPEQLLGQVSLNHRGSVGSDLSVVCELQESKELTSD